MNIPSLETVVEKIDVGFVYFRTTNLSHLDAALFTLSKQNFSHVRSIIFLDNNTDDETDDIQAVLDSHYFPVPLYIYFQKHHDYKKTHSWSVNRFIDLATTDWVFFTRSDYLMNYDCLQRFWEEKERQQKMFPYWRGMITSNCHQMGYDSSLSNTDALAAYSLPTAEWRWMLEGPKHLFGKVPANYFESSGVDAGVWLTQRMNFINIGGMNERMTSWGFNQQEAQQIMMKQGVEMIALRDYLYHHQHHWAERNFQVAGQEMQYAR